MFKAKNFHKLGNYVHKFGQGGTFSQDDEDNTIKSENEDDLLLEELYKFAVKNLPNILGEWKVAVNEEIYHMMTDPQSGCLMTVRRFIGEHYRRGLVLIFDEGADYYIGINVCKDGLEIGIIDSEVYLNYVMNYTVLSLNKETKEITEGKFQVYDQGDSSTDCGSF